MSRKRTLRPKNFWRIRTPTLIQMENVECGAACLAILLSYYGRHVPLEQLREQCGVSRDGSNALNLIRAAEGYGLQGKGMREGLSELYQCNRPAILFWDYNHFLILEGFGKSRAYLNDPAFGPRRVTYEEFDESYTGVVLHFVVTERFTKGGRSPRLMGDMMRRLKEEKFSFLYLFIVGICLLIPGLSIPIFTRIFVDNILISNILPWTTQFLIGMALSMCVGGVLTWLQQYFLNRINISLSIRFSSSFLWHILRLPVSFYTQRFPAEIANRVGQNNIVAQMMTGALATTTIQMFLVIFYGVVMFMYDFSVASIGIFAALGSLVVMRMIQRSRTDTYARLQKELSMVAASSVGAIQQIETIKATGTESNAFSLFAGFDASKVNSLQEISRKDAILITSPILFQGIALTALLGIGGLRVMEGHLSIGTLMALQILLLNFLQPVAQFVNFGQTIQFLKVELLRLNDVLKNPIDRLYVKRERESGKMVKLEGCLEFKNVTFGYNPLSPPLIKGLNMVIRPGRRVALVGSSGCGKSTIAKLATGLLEQWSGEILYDGKPFLHYHEEVMQRSISSVDQEIFLFSGTIRENITLWDDRSVPDNIVIQAAQDACIHHDILKRPLGYETELIEGGRNLSGGQRQRLEIARALLINPSIIIMDEATSDLDSNTEKEVIKNIRKRGCSAMMVAHRLSTIRDCDEIIVLECGEVVERGKHEDLKRQQGIYFQFIESDRANAE